MPPNAGIERVEPRLDVVLEALQVSADDLDVLLRHRLLRQPVGFEGFGAFVEDLHPDVCAFPKRIHDPPAALHRDLTTGRTSPLEDFVDDLVARIDEVGGFDRMPNEGLDPRREPLLRRLPAVDTCVWDVGAGHEHEVVSDVVQPAAEISLGCPVENRSHCLDVLLRHRPRSISLYGRRVLLGNLRWLGVLKGTRSLPKTTAVFRPRHYSDSPAGTRSMITLLSARLGRLGALGPAVPAVVVRLVAAEPSQGGQRRKEEVLQPGRWGAHTDIASEVPERDGQAKRVTRRAA